MIGRNLKAEYFEWMYSLVKKRGYGRNAKTYRRLLTQLHEIEFTYTIDMDENRAVDGVDLRLRFGYDFGHDESIIKKYMMDEPCSVLEMMLALSLKCEEQIMDDPEIGDRLRVWFWEMIDSLDLTPMDDRHYDCDYVNVLVDKFLRREYSSNGHGGLFTLKKPSRDLRSVEIWYQMCWFLDEL